MAGRDKSFTVNIIPHDANRRRRQWIVTGGKLFVFRLLIVFMALAVVGAVLILVVGADELSRNAELSRRNRALSDSLRTAVEMNQRLDAIESELETIRETRLVIENLATAGVPEGEQE